jgi:hypothetical protein
MQQVNVVQLQRIGTASTQVERVSSRNHRRTLGMSTKVVGCEFDASQGKLFRRCRSERQTTTALIQQHHNVHIETGSQW